ncbi:uncharacterized protein ASCRUDRAFT_9451 [Ascoidea rubescens DSM 1968]|uniref:Protein kinase domain-containing protein n=1 Tax=Ascoidea rubescens DSM 1968 TaxID=1344418 RepID=A0A1D2VCM4_9ASCO|nr:hypothetical protein ASCRUDRAFT_9451 [Ascoidea rubescens DSM 1968]ODV59391.1 hypothetical protein ASCRUDRAFT_9451 [Ascoidea rubescens DSM 1968]
MSNHQHQRQPLNLQLLQTQPEIIQSFDFQKYEFLLNKKKKDIKYNDICEYFFDHIHSKSIINMFLLFPPLNLEIKFDEQNIDSQSISIAILKSTSGSNRLMKTLPNLVSSALSSAINDAYFENLLPIPITYKIIDFKNSQLKLKAMILAFIFEDLWNSNLQLKKQQIISDFYNKISKNDTVIMESWGGGERKSYFNNFRLTYYKEFNQVFDESKIEMVNLEFNDIQVGKQYNTQVLSMNQKSFLAAFSSTVPLESDSKPATKSDFKKGFQQISLLHQLQIYHNSIKNSNIFIFNNKFYFIDYGFSSSTDISSPYDCIEKDIEALQVCKEKALYQE